MLINCLYVGLGGAIGSISRYLLGLFPVRPQNGFPLMTLVINMVGAFCIGLVAAFSAKHTHFHSQLLLFLRVGLCGGFTTFSAFSIETVELLQNGKISTAIFYGIFSVILCVAATMAAQTLAK